MQPASVLRRNCAALWLTAALAAAALSPAFAATRIFSDADNGKTVQLKTGERLQVRLESNPTTGFMWSVAPGSTPLLKLVGQSQTSPAQTPPPSSIVGRPITQIFNFQALKPGQGVLLLHYVRSWEKPEPDERKFQLHVSIPSPGSR